jgi:beta-mannosidase
MTGSGIEPVAINAETQSIALDTGWELARVSANVAATPEELRAIATDWLPATVPGTVAAAFPAADPNAWSGNHNLDRDDWWYRCSFALPNIALADSNLTQWMLTFGGLASIADVWLNGEPLLHTENMFISHAMDVTAILRETNEIVIRFSSLHAALAVARPRPRWRTKLVENQQLRWFRTTLLGRMPGWSASPQPVGPWRPITLTSHKRFVVRSASTIPVLEGDDGVVNIAVTFDVIGATHFTDATVTATLDGTAFETDASYSAAGEVTMSTVPPATPAHDQQVAAEGAYVLRATLRVANAQRWWPHTHGAQARYRLAATLTSESGDLVLELGAVGFRTVELDTTHGAFTLRVNGEAIFCRGACWSSIDPVLLTGTDANYREALVLARDAGMNMLRIGGTMVYEADAFYELCDALGILIWQEFMFANMDYPETESFVQTVRAEATQLLQRLQYRPCIALFCGNNEVEQQASMLGLPRTVWSKKLFDELLPDLCATHMPNVPYWPSSPGCGTEGTLPFHTDSGDAHYFGCGPYLRPFSDVRASGVRFASETLAFANVPDPDTIDLLSCGSSGAGHHPIWKSGVPRDNGASWDFEDVRDHYLEQLFHVDPVQLRYSDPERYLALGRVTSGEIMQRSIAEWRRPGSSCHGALIWLYRDLRIGAGWGLIDATGRPKAAYYYVSRASQPVALLLSDEGLNGIHLHAMNDGGAPTPAKLDLALYHGAVGIANASATITIPPHGATTVQAEAMLDRFADVAYAYRFGPPSHNLTVATLTDPYSGKQLSQAFHFPLGLPSSAGDDPGLEAIAIPHGDGSYDLQISARSFAQSVAIQLDRHLPADNYFHMAPASSRTILVRPRGPVQPLTGIVTPLNARSSTRITVR